MRFAHGYVAVTEDGTTTLRDVSLRRVLVYSITPTGNANGAETPYVVRIAAAVYDPDLG
jgi:hypothetical protein